MVTDQLFLLMLAEASGGNHDRNIRGDAFFANATAASGEEKSITTSGLCWPHESVSFTVTISRVVPRPQVVVVTVRVRGDRLGPGLRPRRGIGIGEREIENPPALLPAAPWTASLTRSLFMPISFSLTASNSMALADSPCAPGLIRSVSWWSVPANNFWGERS